MVILVVYVYARLLQIFYRLKEGTICPYLADACCDQFQASKPFCISNMYSFSQQSIGRQRSCKSAIVPHYFQRQLKDSQDTHTRIDVRMRNKRCLITGQAAVSRARGGNFNRLEVAHIFPLMAVNIAIIELSKHLFTSHFPNVGGLDTAYSTICSISSV